MEFKNFKTRVEDYDHYDSTQGPIGVHFYDGKIWDFETDFGVRSYKFCFYLCEDRYYDKVMSPLFPKVENQELLQFTAEVNLLDWMREVFWSEETTEMFPNIKTSRMDFDAEGLAKHIMGDEYEYFRKRLFKKLYGKKKVAKEFEPFYGKSEFLEFTKDSACNWSGPFIHKNKKGAGMNILSHTRRPFDITDNFNLLSSWGYHDLPYEFRETNKEVFNDHKLYHMSHKDKVEFFHAMPRDIQIHTILSGHRRFTEEMLESCKPVCLRLSGNDDTSYTKYFMTEAEAEIEAVYLRKMQPLDFRNDVLMRKYFFTN